MMNALRHMHRYLAVLMIAVWGAIGIVAPAHAAEEDIHHATQHDGAVETASSDEGMPVDEGSIHPEHATHCHSGACHFHIMARGAFDLGTEHLTSGSLAGPRSDLVPQTLLSSLFRPPRI